MAGAPLGNQNGAKGKRWRDAIDRALERRGQGEMMKALDELADDYLNQVVAEKIAGYREFGDRYDGKAAQQLIHSGDPNAPLLHRIERVITESGSEPAK